jgi:hypothetical protein
MIGWFGGESSSAWAAGEYECVYGGSPGNLQEAVTAGLEGIWLLLMEICSDVSSWSLGFVTHSNSFLQQ